MIFASIDNGRGNSELFRVVGALRHDSSLNGHYFTILAKEGWIRTSLVTVRWRFYTGPTATLLTIIYGNHYQYSRSDFWLDQGWIVGDGKIVNIIQRRSALRSLIATRTEE